MRSKKTIDSVVLDAGEYLESVFDNYFEMVRNSVDWAIFCIYQLKPNSLNGVLRVLELPNMQIARTDSVGALMYDFVVPKKRTSLAILDKVGDKSCLDHLKLQSGMIGVMDDQRAYNFIHNDRIQFFDLSLKEGADPVLRSRLAQSVNKSYIDTGKKIARLLWHIIDSYGNRAPLSCEQSARIERQITEALLQMTERQEAREPDFTPSEQVALTIRKQIFNHMDGHFTTASLARQHGISERSLQNAFKSLFGFTPNQFIRLLKLNLVHHELVQSDPGRANVSRVAQKWGFSHLGRFASQYAELFGEAPSISLKKCNPLPNGIHVDCTQRKEEI